jgi:hypothetical protein
MDRYDGPVIASHSNPRALVPGDRQLSDEQAAAIRRQLAKRAAEIQSELDHLSDYMNHLLTRPHPHQAREKLLDQMRVEKMSMIV